MRHRLSFLAQPRVQLLVALLSLALAGYSAVSLLGEVSPPDVILLFFGGFGAGAALTAAIARLRHQPGQTGDGKSSRALTQEMGGREAIRTETAAGSAAGSETGSETEARETV